MSDRLVGIAVTGQGRVGATPDIVIAVVGATAERVRSAEAAEAASTAMRDMVAAAREAGVADADRRTTAIALRSYRQREGGRLRYVATQRLRLRLRDVAAAGDVVAAVLAAGGDAARMDQFGLQVDDTTAYLDRAREEAMADARHRAEHLARLSGRELGGVVSLREFASQPHSMALAGGMRTMAAEAGPGGAPVVEAGEEDIEVQVEVEFDWAD